MHRDRTAAAAIAVVGCRRERRSRLRRRLATISPNLLANIHTLVRPNRPPTISRVYIRKWMDSGERQRMDRPTDQPTDHTSCIFFARAYFICVHMDTSHYIGFTDLMVVMVLAAAAADAVYWKIVFYIISCAPSC